MLVHQRVKKPAVGNTPGSPYRCPGSPFFADDSMALPPLTRGPRCPTWEMDPGYGG